MGCGRMAPSCGLEEDIWGASCLHADLMLWIGPQQAQGLAGKGWKALCLCVGELCCVHWVGLGVGGGME